jgi:hypothetical protein
MMVRVEKFARNSSSRSSWKLNPLSSRRLVLEFCRLLGSADASLWLDSGLTFQVDLRVEACAAFSRLSSRLRMSAGTRASNIL